MSMKLGYEIVLLLSTRRKSFMEAIGRILMAVFIVLATLCLENFVVYFWLINFLRLF